MKYKKQILFGICNSILVWGIFILADLLDEFVLDRGLFIGAINFISLPIIMFIAYINNYLKRKPSVKSIAVYFTSYSISYLILWFTIFYFENADRFIVQRHRSDIIDLNGIEYMFYGFSTLIFFILLCLVFHIVYHFVHKKEQTTYKHFE